MASSSEWRPHAQDQWLGPIYRDLPNRGTLTAADNRFIAAWFYGGVKVKTRTKARHWSQLKRSHNARELSVQGWASLHEQAIDMCMHFIAWRGEKHSKPSPFDIDKPSASSEKAAECRSPCDIDEPSASSAAQPLRATSSAAQPLRSTSSAAKPRRRPLEQGIQRTDPDWMWRVGQQPNTPISSDEEAQPESQPASPKPFQIMRDSIKEGLKEIEESDNAKGEGQTPRGKRTRRAQTGKITVVAPRAQSPMPSYAEEEVGVQHKGWDLKGKRLKYTMQYYFKLACDKGMPDPTPCTKATHVNPKILNEQCLTWWWTPTAFDLVGCVVANPDINKVMPILRRRMGEDILGAPIERGQGLWRLACTGAIPDEASTAFGRVRLHGTKWPFVWSICHTRQMRESYDESQGHNFDGVPGVFSARNIKESIGYSRFQMLAGDGVFYAPVVEIAVDDAFKQTLSSSKDKKHQNCHKAEGVLVVALWVVAKRPHEMEGCNGYLPMHWLAHLEVKP